jgi:glycosyltransferase involved in cell wall biosynthesis
VKILVVSWYMPPFNTMGALRVGKFCKFLDQQGHEVRVLSCADSPYEQSLPVEIPEDRIVRTGSLDVNAIPKAVQKLRVALRGNRLESAASVSRVALEAAGPPPSGGSAVIPAAAPARPGLTKRTLRSLRVGYQKLFNFPDPQIGWYVAGARGGRDIVEGWQPDVIFASAPPFTSLMIARGLKMRTGAPLVVEYRDRLAEDPYSTQEKNLRKKMETLLENWWMKQAAAIITVSEPWAEDYRTRFALPVLSVYNGFDPDDFPADYSREATDPNLLNIVYTGILYQERRDPTPLFKAIKLMGDEGKNVRVSFYGANPGELTEMAVAVGALDHVDIHPQVPYQQSINRQMNADILLLLQWNNPKEQGNVPGKLFEYLGARRPVLGLGLEDGVPARILAERDAGVVVNDPAAIAEHLKKWLAEKRANGKIPLVPLSARHGYSRPEQFEGAEAFLKKAADIGQ